MRKLREGVNLKDAVKILEDYSELFVYELFNLVTVTNGIVKLADKGLKAILKEWVEEIREKLTELKEVDREAYKKLLAEISREISDEL